MAKPKTAAPIEAPKDTTPTDAAATTETSATEAPAERKSIVPSKYAGKYKNGGDDVLAHFIKGQCGAEDKDGKAIEGSFDFNKFFDLCSKNGLPAEQVKKYREQVEAKTNGAPGRARMTLRNMLGTIARKNSKLVGLDGAEHSLAMPVKEKPAAPVEEVKQAA